MEKRKKEKPVYVDDGRTIVDMTNVSGIRGYNFRPAHVPGPSFKEAWKTYWNAVRMMFLPMLAVIAGLGVIYLIVLIIFSIM